MAETAEKVGIKYPIDPDKVDIAKDPFHPKAYVITLPLETQPSYIWQTLFEQELWSSLDFWDRKVLIVGNELKLATTTDHVKEKLQWLENLVLATNRRVDEHNKKAKAERDLREAKILDEEAIRKDVSTWHVRKIRG